MDQLRSDIRSLRRQNAAKHRYIPETLFFKLITKDAIFQSLATLPPYHREEITQRVFEHGRKIFGTLILISIVGIAEMLSKFIEADQLEDARLPFSNDVLRKNIHLSEMEGADFYEQQWELIAPKFRRGTLNRPLAGDTVLPFTKETWIGKGSFGIVYEVVLDPDHQELGTVFPAKVKLLNSAQISIIANCYSVC